MNLVPDPGNETGRYAYQRVAEQLRSAILSQSIPPGRRLPTEHELAKIFAVSRATVREALRSLAAENLITTKRGVAGGSSVAEPSVDRLVERLQLELGLLANTSHVSYENFVELRTFVEVPASRLAATRRNDSELFRLEPEPAEATLAEVQMYRRGRDFHFAVVEMAHNPLLRIAAEPIFLVVQTSLDRERLGPSFHATVSRHHRAIGKAIRDRDEGRAGDLMRDHLDWLEPHYRRVWREPGEPRTSPTAGAVRPLGPPQRPES
ncbi:MAG: GntR family transcriptional regulator [Acidimicrobiales bacterium]|jgi:DNA-binding FadR family transcriptional regulator